VAGIGFILRRVVTDTGPAAAVKGYLAAAIVAAGPWLLSVATMATFGVISAQTLQGSQKDVLFGAILYAYAFSLICIGPVQLVFTRYVADQEYLGRREALGSAFCLVLMTTLGVLFIPAALFVIALPGLSLLFKLSMLALFVGSAGTWLALTFLSAAKDYGLIVSAFGSGYAVGLIGAMIAGPALGAAGYLAAFTVGQMMVFGILIAGVLAEFGIGARWEVDVLGYLRKYPALVLVGLAYNLGMWVDKVVFWFSSTGVTLVGLMHAFPSYDRAMFVSSLVMVPGLTVFVLRVETDFYSPYRGFFEGITGRATLALLHQTRAAMIDALRDGFALLVKVQVASMLIGLLLEDYVTGLVGLTPSDRWLFRIGLLSNSAEVVLLVSLLALLYFDLRRAAAEVALCFLLVNLGATLATVQLGEQWYGMGYLAGSLAGLALAHWRLWSHLCQLEYHTFTDEAIRAEVKAARLARLRRGLRSAVTSLPGKSAARSSLAIAVAAWLWLGGLTPAEAWAPPARTSWQWQLTGELDTSFAVAMYDVDLFNTTADQVATLHAQGSRVVCYLDAGTFEAWRSDASDFPSTLLGRPVDSWEGERWLDIRQMEVLGPIVQRRLDLCQSKGFDGVEFDNVDGFANRSGFPLTPADQLHFNRWLADEAHARGLSAGLKNDLDQIDSLVDWFDWALVEQCFEYEECNQLQPFVRSGKAVFVVEYNLSPEAFCEGAVSAGLNALFKREDVDAYRVACD
jgi:uncharacterized membrane protein